MNTSTGVRRSVKQGETSAATFQRAADGSGARCAADRDPVVRTSAVRNVLLWGSIYSICLIAAIPSTSLWADEAFSAYMACHRSLHALGSTLLSGDSSDLQVWLYYLYLFGWEKVFGFGEFALRAANIPFILVYCFTLAASCSVLFRMPLLLVGLGGLPFLLHYAGEARAYFALLTFATMSVATALAAMKEGIERWHRVTPYILLTCLLVGTSFHLLMILAIPPCAAILLFGQGLKWRLWKKPLLLFSIPLVALAAFELYTFARGTAYQYPAPRLLSMAGVLSGLVGLDEFGPNRQFSVDIRHYAGWLITAAVGLAAGTAILLYCASAHRSRRVLALSSAVVIGVAEVLVLCLLLRKQLDARHCAALVPFGLFWIGTVVSDARHRRLVTAACIALAAVWIAGDGRMLLLQEYKRQDFAAAVDYARRFHRDYQADVVFATDPLGAGYYGAALQGRAPCWPLLDSCAQGLARVAWPVRIGATDALLWNTEQVEAWIQQHRAQRRPALAVVTRDRASLPPSWQRAVQLHCKPDNASVHGFTLCIIPAE